MISSAQRLATPSSPADVTSTGLPIASAHIPRYARAVLEAFAINDPCTDGLQALSESEWKQALAFCDRSQLTLILGAFCHEAMPAWVKDRIDRDTDNHAFRLARLESELFEIVDQLEARGIDYALLKGFTHSPEFTPDPLLRAQADCDLWFKHEDVFAARDVLTGLGYEPICGDGRRHLPPMARPSDWTWDGDYFSPDIPIAVDLHYELWDRDLEGFAAPGEDGFWLRRGYRTFDQRTLHRRAVLALETGDTLAFAAIHALMHLLGGDVRLQRMWEIANFLHQRREDDRFWLEWERNHAPELRKLEHLIFALCALWFRGGVHPIARGELPDDVQLWIEKYGFAPVEGIFHPNKKEIWLHLSLIEDGRKRVCVFVNRLVPRRLPNSVVQAGGSFEEHAQNGARIAPRGVRESLLGLAAGVLALCAIKRSHLRYLAGRLVFHARVAMPTLISGARWWWLRQGLDRNYVTYLTASAFFDLGMMVFVLLYNLYLLDLGLREQFIGQVSGAMTAGTLIGAMPAAWVIGRFGIRNTMAVAFAGVAAACALRVLAAGNLAFLITAFVHGLFLSLWTVSFAPAIASLTDGGSKGNKNRQLAFSFVFAMGMGLGIPGGILGGHLPDLLMRAGLTASALSAKRDTLLIAGATVLLGLGPMLRVTFPRQGSGTVEGTKSRIYPRNRFIVLFLIWLAAWTVATSAFNPFFNAYLSQRLHFSVGSIGDVFAWSQAFQVIAVLMMPLVIRYFGEIKGVAAMQMMTAMMFVSLALVQGGAIAAAVYVACMSFQYMSGPSVYGLLMTRVPVEQRSGASALNFVVSSIFATVAAVGAGAVITSAGYSVLLAACAILAVLAALLFLYLTRFHKAFTTDRSISTVRTGIQR